MPTINLKTGMGSNGLDYTSILMDKTKILLPKNFEAKLDVDYLIIFFEDKIQIKERNPLSIQMQKMSRKNIFFTSIRIDTVHNEPFALLKFTPMKDKDSQQLLEYAINDHGEVILFALKRKLKTKINMYLE